MDSVRGEVRDGRQRDRFAALVLALMGRNFCDAAGCLSVSLMSDTSRDWLG
jgi:hypothetical protein